ncbi:MAG: MYG1 family protein [Spirochaetales bacterium]|nr:MYG1 family protein [Spirochaetales bacterium]
MAYKIVVHDGKAHMDEVLGAALLALYKGEEPEEIIRMNALDAEKKVADGSMDREMWFIDCGMVFDPENRLFDHHQDRDLDCSALLIFNRYFKHLQGTELHQYVELVSKVDTKGAMSLDDFHLVSESRDYFSFSHNILIRTFEENPMLVLKLMLAGLEDKIAFEQAKQVAALWRKEPGNMEIITVSGIKVLVYLEQPPSELRSPLRSEISRLVDEKEIGATYSFDEKIPGARTLYRTDFGHNLLDFTRSSPTQPLFCHNGGFLMKFKPEDDVEWMRLLSESIVN